MTRSDTTIMEDVRCPRRQFWQPTIKPSDVPRLINTNALADSLQFVLFSDLNRWAAKGIGGYNWVIAPHGPCGAIHTRASKAVRTQWAVVFPASKICLISLIKLSNRSNSSGLVTRGRSTSIGGYRPDGRSSKLVAARRSPRNCPVIFALRTTLHRPSWPWASPRESMSMPST